MYTEQALKQAILKAGSGNLCGTIHHSDQGVQYACDAYIRILMEHHIRISMTEDSKPTDNAVAERMNGTLKNEWIYAMSLFSLEEDARMQIAGMIDFYNNERPHMSIGMKKPMDVYSGEVPGKCLWKKRGWRYGMINKCYICCTDNERHGDLNHYLPKANKLSKPIDFYQERE